MNDSIFSFIFKLIGLLLLAFGIHVLALYARSLPMFDNHIILSYVLNFVLTIIIFIAVFKTKHKESAQAAFVFILGSAIKFIAFLLILKPLFKRDGEISGLEIASFFVPYAVCLIFEVFVLSKVLNRQ